MFSRAITDAGLNTWFKPSKIIFSIIVQSYCSTTRSEHELQTLGRLKCTNLVAEVFPTAQQHYSIWQVANIVHARLV